MNGVEDFYAQGDAADAANEARDEPLPHDVEAEAAVLSNVILEPGMLEHVSHLQPADFFMGRHRLIFEAVRALESAARPIDAVSVGTWLKDCGRIQQIGGVDYLGELLNASPAVIPRHLRAHADTVISKSRTRARIKELEAEAAALRTGRKTVEVHSEDNPLELWTPEDTWKPSGPIQWLIEPVTPVGSLGLLVAYGGSYKSWFASDACMAIVSGTKWMGRFQAKQGTSLMIDFEQGHWEVRRRMQRIAHGRGLPIRIVDGQQELVPVDGFRFTSMPSLCLTDSAFYDALLPLAKNYSFIAIDSLAAGSDGINENSAEFAKSLQKLKRLASKTGCAIIVIHHERKGGNDDDPRMKVRGSGAIFAAVDYVLSLQPNGDTFLCSATRERGPKLVAPFFVRVVDTSPDATEVQTFDKKQTGSTESYADLAAEVVDCIRDNPGIGGADAVAKILKKDRKKVGAIITAKISEVVIVERVGLRNSRRLYVKGAEPSDKPN